MYVFVTTTIGLSAGVGATLLLEATRRRVAGARYERALHRRFDAGQQRGRTLGRGVA